MPAAKPATTPTNKYYNPKEVPVGPLNPDGSWTYTFSDDQKRLLFSSLSVFGNLLETTDEKKPMGFSKRQCRIIRALREGF